MMVVSGVSAAAGRPLSVRMVGYDGLMGGDDTLVAAALSCSACGGFVMPERASCPACGSVAPTGPGFPVFDAARFRHQLVVVPARSAAAWVVHAVDLAVVLLTAALVGALLGSAAMAVQGRWPWRWFIIGAEFGLVGGIGAWALVCGRWGWFAGGWVFGKRCVDPVWLLPAVPLVTTAWSKARPLLVDVRAGPDPAGLALPAWDGYARRSERSEAGPVAGVRRRGIPAGAVVLVLRDMGYVHWFFGSCVLGRNPVPSEGGTVLNLPDLGRVLATSHAEIRGPDSMGRVWVEDKDTVSGTWLTHDGAETRLHPWCPVEACFGDTVRLGEYRFQIERAG